MLLEALVRLTAAAVLTALIGMDRELRSKPAGLRTNIVVGTATAAFAFVGAELFDAGDPTRVASQIVSGIGFLGGGVIFASGGKPHGLTTAAALWGSAAVGMACGVAAYEVGLALVLITLAVLWPLDLLARRVVEQFARHTVHVSAVLSELEDLTGVQQVLRSASLSSYELTLTEVTGAPVAGLVVSGRAQVVRELLGSLEALPGVRAMASSGAALREE